MAPFSIFTITDHAFGDIDKKSSPNLKLQGIFPTSSPGICLVRGLVRFGSFVVFIIIEFLFMCMHAHTCAQATAHAWWSEDNLRESAFPCTLMGVIRLGSKHLYLLSHLRPSCYLSKMLLGSSGQPLTCNPPASTSQVLPDLGLDFTLALMSPWIGCSIECGWSLLQVGIQCV